MTHTEYDNDYGQHQTSERQEALRLAWKYGKHRFYAIHPELAHHVEFVTAGDLERRDHEQRLAESERKDGTKRLQRTVDAWNAAAGANGSVGDKTAKNANQSDYGEVA